MIETVAAPVCTQCKTNPRADVRADATNLWCKECRARYQREYSILKMDRKERQGFVKGREAMREMIVREFDRLGSGMFSAVEVAHLVLQMPGPQVAEEAEQST